MEAIQEQSVTLVCGSFFIVQEVTAALDLKDGPCDPIEVNERAFEIQK